MRVTLTPVFHRRQVKSLKKTARWLFKVRLTRPIPSQRERANLEKTTESSVCEAVEAFWETPRPPRARPDGPTHARGSLPRGPRKRSPTNGNEATFRVVTVSPPGAGCRLLARRRHGEPPSSALRVPQELRLPGACAAVRVAAASRKRSFRPVSACACGVAVSGACAACACASSCGAS